MGWISRRCSYVKVFMVGLQDYSLGKFAKWVRSKSSYYLRVWGLHSFHPLVIHITYNPYYFILLWIPAYSWGNNSLMWLMYWLGDVPQGLWDWGSPQCSEICTIGGPGLVLSHPHKYWSPYWVDSDGDAKSSMWTCQTPQNWMADSWFRGSSIHHPQALGYHIPGFSWLMRSAPSPSGWGSLSLCVSLSDRSLLSPVLFNSTASAPPIPTLELSPRAASHPRTVSPPT